MIETACLVAVELVGARAVADGVVAVVVLVTTPRLHDALLIQALEVIGAACGRQCHLRAIALVASIPTVVVAVANPRQ